MPNVETLIIGAGQSGLAVSAVLTAANREHVILDRGAVAERWRSERWDSLRLLTPNWLSRLPGWSYTGADPDGHMHARDVAAYLAAYAAAFRAPVAPHTTVRAVVPRSGGGFRIATSQGEWRARNVVAATGAHAVARMPAGISGTRLPVIPSTRYRRPSALPTGAVLVVGASASGVQVADELAMTGRRVVLAAGRHSRLPRTYRGMDVFWWLERLGKLARTIDQVSDPEAARSEPSLQLIGSAGAPRAVDLGALQERGVELAGRLIELTDVRARFAPGLRDAAAAADITQQRLLDEIDDHVTAAGLDREVLPPDRPSAVASSLPPTPAELPVRDFSCVVLATGLRPDWSWLRPPIADGRGLIPVQRGATAIPGLYVVGQPFQHRRDSTYIDGARHNARDVVAHLLAESPPVLTS